jgi:hypothetical protein
MDKVVRQVEKSYEFRRLQTSVSYLTFEESISRGIPTAKALLSLKKRGIPVPRSRNLDFSLRALGQFVLRHRTFPWFLLSR